MNAAAEAAKMLLQIADQVGLDGAPSLIVLSIYETDHDLAVLRPEDGGKWSAAFHSKVMREVAKRLRRVTKVRLRKLDAAAYLRWLAAEGLTNDAGNRAKFISLQTP